MIAATHNLALGLRLCDRFIILHRGRIVRAGDAAGMTVEAIEELYRDATGA